jgi:hypothetical protein
MAQPTQEELDAAYAQYLANYTPPKKVGIIGGLGTALERAPDTIASQFKSMAGGLTNLNVNAIEAVPGLDFGQGELYTGPLRADADALTRSAQIDRAYQDYINPMPQAGLGKYSAMVGDSLTQAVPALVAGLTTGGLGAAATMAGQYYGESRLSQLEENPNQPVREGRALASGIGQAGVDMTLGRFLGGNLNPMDNFSKGLFGTGLAGSATRGVVAGGLRGAAEEGAAEVIQQAIDRAQVGLDVNPFTSQGARDEYGQSFAMGALLGGGMGAVTGGIAETYDAAKARQSSPEGIAQAFNNRETVGVEGRLKALMDEQAANAAYNQLNPSPFTALGEQITAGGEFDNQRLANEIADARAAARLIEERKQGELLQLPAPDPMAYDPSSVTGRPATQEEILMAQQTGGAPNVAPVLALPNPNTAPIVVDPTGVAQRTDEPLRVEQERAREAIGSPERDVQAATLVQQAAVTKRTQSEPSSPYETRAMLTVRGKPAYTVTVVGPGSKPNTVKVFNNDTRTMVEVPRSRVTSVAEARDPKALNRLSPDVRRAEEVRAKELHQRQLEAIINPQPATEAVPPSAATVEPTTDVGVSPPPPMAEAPVVQGEGSFVNETPVPLTDQPAPVNETPVPLTDQPVAEMPQSAAPQDQPMAGEGLTSYRMKSPYGYVMIGAKDPADAMREASRSTDNPNPADLEVWDGQKYVPVAQPAAPSSVVAENTPPISAQSVAKMPRAQRAAKAAQNKVAQVTTGPAITNQDGPELAAAAEPMSTTDDDAVFAIQKVEAATLDPNFRSQVVLALRDEFRKLGFGSNIPLALEFSDQAGAAAMLKTENGKQTIVIALGLANNTRDVPGAIQAMRPFLTHEVVEFAQKHDLLKPEERTVLLDYAKTHKAADGKTLYETVVERYGDLARANNQPEAYLEREAIAYATEYLTRLNPQKWGDSPQNPAAPRRNRDERGRNLRQLKSAPSAETKTATGFKARIAAFGKALFKGFENAYPAKTADGGTLAQDIAMRLAKGDIAYRARVDARISPQNVQFAGWAVPPAEVTQLGKQLRNYLDSMGLPDVGLRMSTAILDGNGKTWSAAAPGTLGSYYARTITVSMANYDPNLSIEQNLQNLIKVVDHEAVHALRATGAWTPSQWLNLVKFVRNAKDPVTGETYFEKAQRHYGAYTKDMPLAVAQDVLNEEAVAMAFADNFDLTIPRPSGPQKLLDLISQVHMGTASAMYSAGVRSPEMIVRDGNRAFAAMREGLAAKERRELGASSPAETAVKFALAETKTQRVNPAMEPDSKPPSLRTKLFDPSFRTRNPLAGYKPVKERVEDVSTVWTQQRERSFILRIPFLGAMLDPRANMADPGLFTLLRDRTLGDIEDQHKYITDLKLQAEKIIGNDSKLEKAVRDYVTTKGADPAMIPNPKLAAIVAEMKTMVSTVGRNLVELGMLSKESFEAMDGSYLHRRYLDSTKPIFSSTRMLLADIGFLKERTNPNIAERAAKGEELDTLTSMTAYLAKATHAMYIANAHQTILGVSALEDPNTRHWVIGAEDTIVWNGRRQSPFAIEAEVDGNLQSLQDLRANIGLAKNPQIAAKNKEKLDKATSQVASKARVLLRNKLWLGRKGANPTQVVEALGIQLSNNGTVPEDALTKVSDDQIIQLFTQIRSGGINFSDVQRQVVWREKVWSVLDMEREIDRIEDEVFTATQPLDESDAARAERLRLVKESVRTGKIQLMRNTLWQNLRQVNPDEVVAELGDFTEAAVNRAYDSLRTRQALSNQPTAKDGLLARAMSAIGSYVPGVSNLNDNIVQVPDTARWGSLRGMLMAREVYDILNGSGSFIENTVDKERGNGDEGMSFAKVVQQSMTVFKGSSTVLNPGTHITNWVGNLIQGSMYGGIDPVNWMKHVGFAFGEVLNAEGDAYNALRERGGIRGSSSLADVSIVTDPMRLPLERIAQDIVQNFDMAKLKDDPAGVAAAFIKYGMDLGKTGFVNAAGFYQLSDSVMKVALMRCHMQRGLTADEAYLNAQKVFFDYGMVPPFVRAARNIPIIGSPFLSWTYMATALTIESLGSSTVLRRFENGTELRVPTTLFIAPLVLAYAATQAANMADDEMEDEDRKFLVPGLPPFAKGGFGFMYGGLDANGRPQFVDMLKYTSFGTLLKLAGLGGEMQGKYNDTGIPAALKEVGFFGSDPYYQILQAFEQELRSGKSAAEAGSIGFENTGDILSRSVDVFLPPLARGLGDGSNPIVGDAGLLRSTPVDDSGILPYQNNKPALSFWQKAAKIGGFGVYVVDIVPSLENNVKQSKALVADIKTQTRKIYNDAYLTPEQKQEKIGDLEVRAERVLTRLAEAEALFDEAVNSEFYRNYRENVMEMGLPDPVISNAENKKIRDNKISAQEYEAIWRASNIDVPEN